MRESVSRFLLSARLRGCTCSPRKSGAGCTCSPRKYRKESDDEPNIHVDERWLFERGIVRR